jgi:nitroreductase
VEFQQVVRRRKMVRTFEDLPIDPEAAERILRTANRAPSAGFTQGISFLVFRGDEVQGFWDAAFQGEEPDGWAPGLMKAPLVIVPLASKQAYVDRYAEPDKGWTDRDESRRSAPYWYVDASFASMLILLAAVDEGLGALFFGIFPPENVPAMLRRFGVPEEFEPIGAIAVGHPGEDLVASSAGRGRKPLEDVVHRGSW